jgi:hypothetical protein
VVAVCGEVKALNSFAFVRGKSVPQSLRCGGCLILVGAPDVNLITVRTSARGAAGHGANALIAGSGVCIDFSTICLRRIETSLQVLGHDTDIRFFQYVGVDAGDHVVLQSAAGQPGPAGFQHLLAFAALNELGAPEGRDAAWIDLRPIAPSGHVMRLLSGETMAILRALAHVLNLVAGFAQRFEETAQQNAGQLPMLRMPD